MAQKVVRLEALNCIEDFDMAVRSSDRNVAGRGVPAHFHAKLSHGFEGME